MNEDTIYIMCECVTDESCMSMDIINESTVESPITGTPAPTITIDTTLQSFEVPNWNTRIYGGDLVMSSLDNDGMIQNDIKRGQWIGEWGHPLDLTPRRQMILNPPTSSHRILNYRRVGNLLKGHVQTLPYGYGLQMAANIRNNIPASFSLRSLGTVDKTTRRVKAPLKIITYDSVYRPSHIEAYQDSILSETAGDMELNAAEPLFEAVNINMDEIMNYVKDKSTNLQIVADMFKLDNIEGTLLENGTRMNVTVDDNTTVNVSIESVLNSQYAEMLKSIGR